MKKTSINPPPKSIETNSEVNRANAQFRFAEIYVHWHIASCVLSCSLRFPQPKTTCPILENGEGTRSEVVRPVRNLSMCSGSVYRFTTNC